MMDISDATDPGGTARAIERILHPYPDPDALIKSADPGRAIRRVEARLTYPARALEAARRAVLGGHGGRGR